MSPLTSADRDLLRRVRAYSPITEDQRKAMDALFTWISRQKRLGLKEEQRIADTFRAPVQTVGRAMVAGVVEYGLYLERLQERVPRGTWMHLFRDTRAGAKSLLRPIPLSIKQAQAYMRIARHPTLGDPGTFDALPPHWRTLDELTRVPPAVLNAAITRGTVHPEMERADVAALRTLDRLPGMSRLGPVAEWPTPDEGITEEVTEEDVDRALDQALALAVHARLSSPAMARKLRARAATLEADAPGEEDESDETIQHE